MSVVTPETETLTAEERALLENLGDMFEQSAKLLRLYDAALARAEAAERLESHYKSEIRAHREAHQETSRECEAAESRLAAAVDCIKGVRGYLHSRNAGSSFNLPGPVAQRARDLISGFLSTAPAQTAAAEALESHIERDPINAALSHLRAAQKAAT